MSQTQARSTKLSKAEADALLKAEMVGATKADKEAVSDATTRIGKGKSAKVQSKRDKAVGKGIKRDWSKLGHEDAKTIWTADKEAGTKMVTVLAGLSRFAALGFAPKGNDKQKKRMLPDEIETYFKGWRNYQETLSEAEKKSFNVRYAEARRVAHAYILRYEEQGDPGVESINTILTGPGTYHQKVASLPTMTGGGQGQGTRAKKADAGTNKVAEAMKAAEATQRVALIAQFTEKEIGEIVANLPETQVRALAHAAALRLIGSSDPVNQEIGKEFKGIMERIEKAADSKLKLAA